MVGCAKSRFLQLVKHTMLCPVFWGITNVMDLQFKLYMMLTVIYLSVYCPGGTGDSKAYFDTLLDDKVESLPDRFYVVTNNAYMLSAHALIPYSGKEKKDPDKDVFFYFVTAMNSN